MRKLGYKHTVAACCIGYITQAIVATFVPLLFVQFQNEYAVTLSQLSVLVFVTFAVQLMTDLALSKLLDFISARVIVIVAHVFSAVGLAAMCFLPQLMSAKFAALMTAVVLYSIGGGMIEVIVSPLVTTCPSSNNPALMSVLHSFYSWGQVLVVLLSTAYFALFGVANWRYMALVWAALPTLNAIYFCFVPVDDITDNSGGSGKAVFSKSFFIMLAVMLCGGASEIAIGQWASAFAEEGLGISKTQGDLAGVCLFAVGMGLSRVLYSRLSGRIRLIDFMIVSAVFCIAGYLISALVPVPLLALAGCAICGFSVGIMWPGTLSLASKHIKGSGGMFALLAFGGDIGCSVGPAVVGLVSQQTGGQLRHGLLAATVFPLMLLVGIIAMKHSFAKAEQ